MNEIIKKTTKLYYTNNNSEIHVFVLVTEEKIGPYAC